MTTYVPPDLTDAHRGALLDDQIERFAWRGWRLSARTATTAQMIKPKQFSAVAAILWFLVCGVGVLVYLFLYLAQQDDMVWLTIREQGQVNGRWKYDGQKWPKLPGDWECERCLYINREQRSACLRCHSL